MGATGHEIAFGSVFMIPPKFSNIYVLYTWEERRENVSGWQSKGTANIVPTIQRRCSDAHLTLILLDLLFPATLTGSV